jgi:hypothetical protein
MEVGGQLHAPAALPPGESWVGPRAYLNAVGKVTNGEFPAMTVFRVKELSLWSLECTQNNLH